MAAAEARAAWQRAANRCFVQEDAKRAPKLACCPSSTSTPQHDSNNGNATNGQDHFTPNFVPLNWNPMNSNLPPDTRWWLQLQPSFRCHKDFVSEQHNVLEDELEEKGGEVSLSLSPLLFFDRIFSPQMEGSLKPMDAEQLRENAHKMVDFIADYYKNLETFPVLSQVKPGYLKELLPDSAPDHPESLQDVLDDIRQKIVPGVTHWQSPNYFAYYPSNSSTAGFLGEMLSAGFNIVGFSWVASPAATELEVIVLDWLAKMLKLPNQFLSSGQGGGVIQGTASEAVLVVLLAARDKILRKSGKRSLEKLVVYASDQTHFCMQKACQIAGIYPENIRLLKADQSSNYALAPEAVSEAISSDLSAGLIPFFLCATVGTTSSAAVDPLSELGKVSKANDMWFHVDAAHAGSACICPEYRHYLDGVEEADSFGMNAHKWFLTNFDCSVLWVKDRSALIQSLSINPEYLKNKASQTNTVVDFKDWQIPLGRRFRSLKLWMVLRLYGLENLQRYIRNHIKLAEQFEELVNSDSRFEVFAPRTLSLVCFRLLPPSNHQDDGDKLNYNLLDAVNSSGKVFLSHTVLSGKFVLRFAVGAPLTEETHVNEAWKALQNQTTILLARS